LAEVAGEELVLAVEAGALAAVERRALARRRDAGAGPAFAAAARQVLRGVRRAGGLAEGAVGGEAELFAVFGRLVETGQGFEVVEDDRDVGAVFVHRRDHLVGAAVGQEGCGAGAEGFVFAGRLGGGERHRGEGRFGPDGRAAAAARGDEAVVV